jgi:hypothetical protein
MFKFPCLSALVLSFLFFSCGGSADKKENAVNDSIRAGDPGVLYAFEQGEYIGFKDAKGHIILPARYMFTVSDTFSRKAAIVIDSVGGPMVIDKTGKKILSPYIYDNGPDYVVEGVFRVVDENKKMGFADLDGNVVIPIKYDFVTEFHDGLACFGSGYTVEQKGEMSFMKGGKWGFIDHKGDTIIPQVYDEMNWFESGTVTLKKDGKTVTLDKAGKEVKGK